MAGRVAVPTLAPSGAEDRMTPPPAPPNGLFRTVDRAGRFPNEERPRRVAEQIAGWLPQ